MPDEGDLPPQNPLNLLAIRPQGAQLDVIRPGSSLVSRIAGEAYKNLPIPADRLWRVGDYDVNERSYRRINIWLDQIRTAGEEWTLEDFAEIQDELWISDFRIVRVNFPLEIQLNHIDLFDVPDLRQLTCAWAGLTEIDLSHVPNLNMLDCALNELKELDLSAVPKLDWLNCSANNLIDLDLSHVPNLTYLDSEDNPLAELDLTHVPSITGLRICGSNIMNLDLSSVPKLTELTLFRNRLTEIDIRSCLTSEFGFLGDRQVIVHKRPDQALVKLING